MLICSICGSNLVGPMMAPTPLAICPQAIGLAAVWQADRTQASASAATMRISGFEGTKGNLECRRAY
jgi:hypothetical protein